MYSPCICDKKKKKLQFTKNVLTAHFRQKIEIMMIMMTTTMTMTMILRNMTRTADYDNNEDEDNRLNSVSTLSQQTQDL